MMERLTKHKFWNVVSEKQEKTGIHCSNFCNNCSRGTGDCKHLKAMVEKLAAYEDAEEQGLLMKLPCKVGDTVYTACAWGIESGVVGSIEIISDRIFVNNTHGEMIGEAHNIFLAQAEAEQKLKEMKP